MSPLEARKKGMRHEVQRTWVTRQSTQPIPGITGPAFSPQVGHTHPSPRGDREPFSPALALSAAPQTPSEGLSQPHRCLPRIWLETGSVTLGPNRERSWRRSPASPQSGTPPPPAGWQISSPPHPPRSCPTSCPVSLGFSSSISYLRPPSGFLNSVFVEEVGMSYFLSSLFIPFSGFLCLSASFPFYIPMATLLYW